MTRPSLTAPAQWPRETRDSLFLLLVIACCLLPLSGHIPPWASATALLLLLWRAWLAWRSQPLPGRWVTALVLALVLLLTWQSHRTLVGHEAGVTLIAMLLALKTLELRARRDAMVVFFLGFFTLLANFFFSQSLLTAAAILLALLGLLTALVNAHKPVGRPPLTESLRTAASLTLLGAPLMVLLFLLFPRLAPLWGLPADALAGKSGLSGQMTVGNLASLALDDSVAMRVRFNTPGGQPPPQNTLYFRGPVLTAFNGRDWYTLAQPEAQAITWAVPTPAQLQVQGAAIDYEVTLEPQRQPWLLTLDASAQAPLLPAGMQARMTPELLWLSNRPIVSVLRYQAQSHVQFRHGPLQAGPLLRPYLQLPAGSNPRTRALAEAMLADPKLAQATPQQQVQQVLARLRDDGYRYTLEPGVFGEHSADEFWFDRKAGFCEHIASAFVVLLRNLHIPARIVTGYQGGQMNPVDSYWTVRQSDAHAWAEVWFAGSGWQRVDPTGYVAPDRIGQLRRLQAPRGMLGNAMDAVITAGLAEHLRALWEASNNRWNQWVLNYTQGRQMELLQTLGFTAPSWQDLVQLLGAALGAAALLVSLLALWQRQHQDPWLRLLTHTRQRLTRAGLPLPDSNASALPPRRLAELALAHFGPPAQPLAQWLLQLEQARYAAQAEHSLGQLKRQWRRLTWPLKS